MEQWVCLFSRCLHDVKRNGGANIGKVMQQLSTAVITIALYVNMGSGDVVAVQERDLTGILFYLVVNGLFGPLFATVAEFSPEVNIVMRERTAKLYTAGPYYFAKVAVSLPFDVFPLVIGCSLTYWVLDFNHSIEKFIVFLFFLSAMSCCSQAIGFFLSILAGGDPQIASAGVGPLALVLMLLGGFYVNTETLPIYLTWISKGSYLTFSYQGICINEFRNALLLADGVEIDGEACPPDAPQLCRPGEEVLNDLFNNGQPQSTEEWEALMVRNMLKLIAFLTVSYGLGLLALAAKGPKFMRRERVVAQGKAKGADP